MNTLGTGKHGERWTEPTLGVGTPYLCCTVVTLLKVNRPIYQYGALPPLMLLGLVWSLFLSVVHFFPHLEITVL
jgi:hypothetical protein